MPWPDPDRARLCAAADSKFIVGAGRADCPGPSAASIDARKYDVDAGNRAKCAVAACGDDARLYSAGARFRVAMNGVTYSGSRPGRARNGAAGGDRRKDYRPSNHGGLLMSANGDHCPGDRRAAATASAVGPLEMASWRRGRRMCEGLQPTPWTAWFIPAGAERSDDDRTFQGAQPHVGFDRSSAWPIWLTARGGVESGWSRMRAIASVISAASREFLCGRVGREAAEDSAGTGDDHGVGDDDRARRSRRRRRESRGQRGTGDKRPPWLAQLDCALAAPKRIRQAD